MTLGYIIKPEALNELVITNALRCAKVVLVGKNPELHGFRADPNCMTQFGFFPLHRAAEMFSVDMIELLLHHGASANLRTSGALVIDNLLPVHVAVENTCLHTCTSTWRTVYILIKKIWITVMQISTIS